MTVISDRFEQWCVSVSKAALLVMGIILFPLYFLVMFGRMNLKNKITENYKSEKLQELQEQKEKELNEAKDKVANSKTKSDFAKRMAKAKLKKKIVEIKNEYKEKEQEISNILVVEPPLNPTRKFDCLWYIATCVLWLLLIALSLGYEELSAKWIIGIFVFATLLSLAVSYLRLNSDEIGEKRMSFIYVKDDLTFEVLPYYKEKKIKTNHENKWIAILTTIITLSIGTCLYWPDDRENDDSINRTYHYDSSSDIMPSTSTTKRKSIKNKQIKYTDTQEEKDPYDDPDWDESTPGESEPEYFIRGNIPDPELYPEEEVKRWVEEHGTEDEKGDVENGNY